MILIGTINVSCLKYLCYTLQLTFRRALALECKGTCSADFHIVGMDPEISLRNELSECKDLEKQLSSKCFEHITNRSVGSKFLR